MVGNESGSYAIPLNFSSILARELESLLPLLFPDVVVHGATIGEKEHCQ